MKQVAPATEAEPMDVDAPEDTPPDADCQVLIRTGPRRGGNRPGPFGTAPSGQLTGNMEQVECDDAAAAAGGSDVQMLEGGLRLADRKIEPPRRKKYGNRIGQFVRPNRMVGCASPAS